MLMNGLAVPIFYVDANQVNVQVPFEISAGQVTVQVVRDNTPGNRVTAVVDSMSPRLFPLRQLPLAPDGSPYGVVINNSDGTLAVPSNLGVGGHPAKPGDVIIIYALGLGPVTPFVATGAAAPAREPLARTSNPIQVSFGSLASGIPPVTPTYAGLAPGYAGLYQINVAIPLNVPTGSLPVNVAIPGHPSNTVDLVIASQ